MKNVKINLDRPAVDSKSIQGHKDFGGLMKNHVMMAKPFYKSPWFIGTTGLASISLVAGIVAYNTDDPVPQEVVLDSQAPPELTVPDNRIIAFNADVNPKEVTDNLVKDTFRYSVDLQKSIDDNNNTLEESSSDQSDQSNQNIEPIVDVKIHEDMHDEVQEDASYTSLLPRIGGKVNGSISKEQLFDNKGITTESDVSVIHFELHLIDGLGGKVFEEESNQLNAEMKAALKKITSGETIYFENIKGQTDKGDVVRLNPLRYVLMN